MALTAEQIRGLILVEVGDDAAGTLAANLDLLWERHDGVADLTLRGLLTRRDAIALLLGRARQQVDVRTAAGSAVSLSQVFAHLTAMLAATESAIAQIQSGAGGGVAIGPLTATAPIRPATGQVDPNRRGLRGDPLKRP